LNALRDQTSYLLHGQMSFYAHCQYVWSIEADSFVCKVAVSSELVMCTLLW